MTDGEAYEFSLAFVRQRYGMATPPDWRTRCQTVAGRLKTHLRGKDPEINGTILLRYEDVVEMAALLDGER